MQNLFLGRHVLHLAIACLGLAGCVSIGKTSAEFRQRSPGVVEFSTPMALRPAFEVIKANTERCQTGDAAMATFEGLSRASNATIRITVETTFDEPPGSASIDLRFRNLMSNMLMQDIVLATRPDGTRVTVYKWNDSKKWTGAALAVQGWLDGDTACVKP